MSNDELETVLFNHFPNLSPTPIPSGLLTPRRLEGVSLISKSWKGEGIRRARLCRLEVSGKFFAETLVIYPSEFFDVPIFGSEYIGIEGKKYFGVVDFHPLSVDRQYIAKYIDKYLYGFPDRKIEISKFYDLDRFFSRKMWMERSGVPIYDNFVAQFDLYLGRFNLALKEAQPKFSSSLSLHANYDKHMGDHDPARGILKAYFSSEFADYYIENFLFNSMSESNAEVEKNLSLC
jgi:15,16-dihydrobiliverdin:ferredoxin oxidoreductase